MKKCVLTLAMLLTATYGWAADHEQSQRQRETRLSAELEPANEVPAVFSPASGSFRATIDYDTETIDYQLTFDGLQAPITQSHIHFAQPNVNGGIMVWLCGTTTNPGPTGTQVCPQSGTITGTVGGANVVAISAQGILTGADVPVALLFDKLVEVLRSGFAYANIHTVQSPSGEIRGQIQIRGRK